VLPGAYRIVLTVDGQDFNQTLRVEVDPDAPPALTAQEEKESELMEEEEEEELDRFDD
jgi:hypothetical protein